MQDVYAAIRRIVGVCRSYLRNEILLHDLQSSLGTSNTPDKDWMVLRDTCKSWGLDNIGMRLSGRDYSAELQKGDSSARWSFEVQFSPDATSDRLVVGGGLEDARNLPLFSLGKVLEEKLTKVED